MIAGLLWLLATVDSAFIRGALFGQLAVLIVGVITALALVSSSDAAALFSKLELIGTRMLTVYIPYALIILITFCIRAVPSVDIKSITSVLIFGPFTFIRPLIVLAGAVWGVVAAPGAITIAITVLIVSLMLGLEYILSSLRSRGAIS